MRRKPRFRERKVGERVETVVPRVDRPTPPQASRPAQSPARVLAEPRLAALTVEHALYIGIAMLAFALRFWDIGSRAMHGDEAVHAWFAWNLYNGTGYHYDPVYHGPLQFLVTAAFFFLFGVSNASARLMAVLFGTGLIGLVYLLRPYLGRTAALLGAFFISVSPAFVYVSRLERDDIFTSFFALLLAISVFSFVRTRRVRWVYTGAAAAALSLSAMENTYITLFVFGSFVFIVMATELLMRGRHAGTLVAFWSRTDDGGRVAWPVIAGAGLVLFLALALTTVTGLYLPVPLVLGVLIVLMVHRHTVLETAQTHATPFLDALRNISREQWLNALAIVIAILVVTFSTFGTNLTGIWDATQSFWNTGRACPQNPFPLNPCRKDIIGGLFYWLSQHQVHRGGQPWFYYTLLFGLYEQIAVIFGLGGAFVYARKPTMFTAFLLYWGILMFGIYSWAGEKFSWLMIHPLLPFILLAALAFTELLRVRSRISYLALGVGGVLLLLQVHSMYEVNFVNGADPVEMMVYVQSSPDTPRVAADILNISNKVTNGLDLHISIDSDDTWPFAWYLRDLHNVAYPSPAQLSQKPFVDNPVLIVDEAHVASIPATMNQTYSVHRYHLRWWFPEDYKTWSWSSFGSRALQPSSWLSVGAWLVQRRQFGPKQSVNFYYYVKRGLVSPY
ncbi:MAG: hypothetical protein PVSMB7_06370 [Chloroflexota bacterium]